MTTGLKMKIKESFHVLGPVTVYFEIKFASQIILQLTSHLQLGKEVHGQ